MKLENIAKATELIEELDDLKSQLESVSSGIKRVDVECTPLKNREGICITLEIVDHKNIYDFISTELLFVIKNKIKTVERQLEEL